MIDIIFESIKRICVNRKIYIKRVVSVILSIAIVIVIQCIAFNMLEQLSDKNIRKKEKITIEILNKDGSIKENELLIPSEVTEIVNLYDKGMRITSEEWEEAVICKFSNLPKVQFIAVTSGYIIQNLENIIEGRIFSENDEKYGLPRIIIPDILSKKIFGAEIAVGRTLQFAADEHGIVEFEIIGVYETDNCDESQNEEYLYEIYVNYEYLKNAGMIEDKNSKLLEYYVNVNSTDMIKENLRNHLNERYKETDSSLVITSELEETENSNKIIKLIMKIIQSFAVIAFVIGNLGIMNLSLMDIEKRIKEIGIKMAVGAETKHIIVQIIAECVFLSFIGTIAGIIIGCLCGSAINIFICIRYKDILSSFMFYMPWRSAIYSALGSLLIGLVFSIIPAKRASEVIIIEAIRVKD